MEFGVGTKFCAGAEETQESQVFISFLNFEQNEEACYQMVYEDLVISIGFKHGDTVIKDNQQALNLRVIHCV